MLIETLIQLLLPVAFTISAWGVRQPSRQDWLLSVLPFVGGMLFMLISQPWQLTSQYLRWLWLLLFPLALILSYRQIGAVATAPRVSGLMKALNLLIALVLGGLALLGLRGYVPPANTVDLALPFEPGVYLVGNGGDSLMVNGHQAVETQRYAVDFLGLNGLGRSQTLGADGLESYAIFGVGITSPCAGAVLSAVDAFPDLPVGERDTNNLAGNYVVVDCDGVAVVLAHMQAGSVQVAAGDVVEVGELLGRVGNSGNTSEPHLHIHATRGSTSAFLQDGEPVAITFDGSFLVRNQIVSQP